ncbi:hypothetical protein BLNAU_22992 [Blattamonas nauphoetae]|uniref:Uncharacterized protein n=1 Tax=Blattamonas nauphoetae TaxID=2049346 RepID=A0ABQ9WRH8_9EUKA|nr:hypothetical protein BLNAU_22992 [Blattamonas nauphoetae]
MIRLFANTPSKRSDSSTKSLSDLAPTLKAGTIEYRPEIQTPQVFVVVNGKNIKMDITSRQRADSLPTVPHTTGELQILLEYEVAQDSLAGFHDFRWIFPDITSVTVGLFDFSCLTNANLAPHGNAANEWSICTSCPIQGRVVVQPLSLKTTVCSSEFLGSWETLSTALNEDPIIQTVIETASGKKDPKPAKRLSKVVELDFGVQKLNEAGRVDEETTRMRQNASALQPVQLDQQPLHELFSGVPQPSTQSSSLSAFPGTTPQAAHPSFYPGTTPMGTSHKCLSALCPTINRVPLSSATLSSEHILNSASPDSSYKPDSYFEHTRPQPQLSLLKPVVAAVRKPQYNILSLNTRVSYDSTLRPQQSPYVETSRKQQQFAEKQTTQSLITQLKTYLEQIQRITVNRKLLIALTLDMNDFEQFFNDSGYQNNMDQTNNGIESTLTLLSFLSPGLFFTKVKPKHNRTESGQSIIHKNLSFFHQQGPTTIYQESPQRCLYSCMLPNKHSRVEILSLHRYERPLARQLPHTMSIVWAPRTLTAGQLTPRQKPNRSPTSHSSSPDSVEMVPMDQHSHHTAPLPFHNQGDTHNECDAIYNPSPLLGQTILLRKQMNKRSGHSLLPTPTPPPRSGLCWPLLALS